MKLRIFLTCLLVVFINSTTAWSGKILAVFPLSARSHFKSFQPLFEEIVNRGHELTVISGYRLNDENLKANYTYIDVKHQFNKLKIVFSEMRQQNRLENLMFCLNKIHDYNEYILKVPEVQALLNSATSFDLVLVELFYTDVYVTFGYHFNAPVIGLSPLPLFSYYNWLIGNPQFPAYSPNLFLPFTEKMSFIQRTINVGYNLITGLYYELYFVSKYQKQMEKYIPFGDKPIPKFRDLMTNISVALVNSHYSINYVKPSSPNVIDIAGLHIVRRKPLPEILQKFMDGASHGIIYISLGSLIEPQNINQVGQCIVDSLSHLPQRIVFKWDVKLLPRVPANVLIQEWMPQIDILNHPNCRLFVTHGGLHSLLESINTSVPIVGVPFFTDQHHNLAIVEYYKMGKMVTYENLEKDLLPAVQEILNDSTYRKNMKKRSRLFNERQSNPLDMAMYWVEHVLANKDSSHLKCQALNMPWYQLFLLDIIAVVFLIVILVNFLIYHCVRICLRGQKYMKNNSRILSKNVKSD